MESFLYSPLSIHQLAIYNCHNRTHRRSRNPRSHDRRRIHIPVLDPIRLCQAKTKKLFSYLLK